MKNPIPPVPVETSRLPNGLTVFVVEDHALPIVAVNVSYQVGSKDERPGRTGLAHLFEHMMFQGSKHWNDNYSRPLQEIGGSVNGGTTTDRTRYWEIVPAGYLERALWLESDRMGFLLDALTQERLDNQRAVVKNERRQNYDNRPYGLVRERIAPQLYPPHHPYHWIPIGSMADLDAASLDDVREFFRTYYAPNDNASLCIAGDVSVGQARELAERCFAEPPPGPPVPRVARWTPELKGLPGGGVIDGQFFGAVAVKLSHVLHGAGWQCGVHRGPFKNKGLVRGDQPRAGQYDRQDEVSHVVYS